MDRQHQNISHGELFYSFEYTNKSLFIKYFIVSMWILFTWVQLVKFNRVFIRWNNRI